MKTFLRYWFPLLVWLTLIFVGSTDVLSGERTSLFMIPFLHRLFPHLLLPALERIELIIRKAGHLSVCCARSSENLELENIAIAPISTARPHAA